MNNGLFGFPGPYTRTGGDGIAEVTSTQRWPWPDGARYVLARFVGGGGGGSGAGAAEAGADGGDTSVAYAGTTTTAEGGDGGSGSSATGRGGNAGGGMTSIKGQTARDLQGGGSAIGRGGLYIGVANTTTPDSGGGGFAESGGQGGSGGEYVEVLIERKVGLNFIDVVIGAGGTRYSSSAQHGADGKVIFQWLPPLHTA